MIRITINRGLIIKAGIFFLTCFAFGIEAKAANSVLPSSPIQLTIMTKIPRSGFSMGFGFDALWMMSDGRLVRASPTDNSVTEIEIPVSEAGASLADIDKYRGIGIGEGAVWVPDLGSSSIYKIDPKSNQVVMNIPTDIFGGGGSIGIGEGSVWVVTFDSHDKTLTRYNAQNGAEEAKIPLSRPAKGVLVAFGAVWVTAANAAELYRIDPKANRVVSTTAIYDKSHIMASDDDSIWIAFDTKGTAQRIDGATGTVVATIETHASDMESDGDIAVGGGFVWIITRGSTVAQIDPKANLLKGLFQPPTGQIMGRRIRYGGGSLWISGGSIFRIRPPS